MPQHGITVTANAMPGDVPGIRRASVQLTNRLALPAPLVNALKRQRYSRGASRASITQLIDSPRIDVLRKYNDGRLEVDASDRLWALLGTALHAVLESGGDEEYLPEERLFASIEGWTISGGIDLQHLRPGPPPTVGLQDYKVTSVWSVLNTKPAWVHQLNSYAWLVREAKGWTVEDLAIVAILRDWQRTEARRRHDYPQAPIQIIPVPLWSPEDAEAYIRGRVRAHQDADRRGQWGETLPLCTPEERWAKPTSYAVMRPGRKSALRVLPELAMAEAFAAANPGTSIIHRPGTAVRCAGNYCGVRQWCDQYQEESEE
jgi:hypothetical protein